MSFLQSRKYARKSDSDFVVAAARAFYVCYWAGTMKQDTISAYFWMGADLTEIAPATQRWAFKLARQLTSAMCALENVLYEEDLCKKLEAISTGGDDRLTEENLGWYCAMQAMGYGVGLYDLGIKVETPYMEAYP